MVKKLLLFCAFLSSLGCIAQDNQDRKYSISVLGGPAVMLSELEQDPGLQFNLGIDRKLNKFIFIETRLGYAVCRGSKPEFISLGGSMDLYNGKLTRSGLSLRSNIISGSLGFAIDYTPVWLEQTSWSARLHAGIGMFGVHSELLYTDRRDSIADSQQSGKLIPNPGFGATVTETYEGRHIFIPFGISIHKELYSRISLVADFGFNLTRSDDLDVVNQAHWTNRDRDHWCTAGLGLVFKL